VEENLHDYFGKHAKPDEAVLITTQVAEAGLNISAPLVITELCPMDSLLQRAGRCQRFKNGERELHGVVFVVKPEGQDWYLPYIDSIRIQRKQKSKTVPIAEITRIVLEKQSDDRGAIFLGWEREKELIAWALDDAYKAFLSGSNRIPFENVEGKILGEVFQSLGGGKNEGG